MVVTAPKSTIIICSQWINCCLSSHFLLHPGNERERERERGQWFSGKYVSYSPCLPWRWPLTTSCLIAMETLNSQPKSGLQTPVLTHTRATGYIRMPGGFTFYYIVAFFFSFSTVGFFKSLNNNLNEEFNQLLFAMPFKLSSVFAHGNDVEIKCRFRIENASETHS